MTTWDEMLAIEPRLESVDQFLLRNKPFCANPENNPWPIYTEAKAILTLYVGWTGNEPLNTTEHYNCGIKHICDVLNI